MGVGHGIALDHFVVITVCVDSGACDSAAEPRADHRSSGHDLLLYPRDSVPRTAGAPHLLGERRLLEPLAVAPLQGIPPGRGLAHLSHRRTQGQRGGGHRQLLEQLGSAAHIQCMIDCTTLL